MSVQSRLAATVGTAVSTVALIMVAAAPASATIHPIVQSIACAAPQAFAHTGDVANPPGQTPEGFTTDAVTLAFPFAFVDFPEPLTFTQSDFRALIATGFVDEVVTNADGEVTRLIVDLRNVPSAAKGQGGAHCAN